jgi:hypothetical protein
LSEPSQADVIRDLGNTWLTEVADLRALRVPDENGELRQARLPEPGEGPDKAYATLLTVRASLDRVEEILSMASAMASAARISAREAADLAADELDRKITVRSSRAREFEAARERIAAASLDALEPRIAARSRQKLADQATDIEARIRLAHRGLDSTRTDLIAALRHASWESSLDR